ncbi:uncharacterized protein N7498_001186 [Penicillium cinerascens]|uniref:Uncharacterized protein n=1 Tax=Penicillium cinerascens TaxID=70096 RepID=A0A9W9NFP4_9EURO|nr:uncharacterized protein N7498_001186 [Penicillium cinerascens]KAJ5219087.1 hypothetical protein N7498_001186 [Penicillium cinerascens]
MRYIVLSALIKLKQSTGLAATQSILLGSSHATSLAKSSERPANCVLGQKPQGTYASARRASFVWNDPIL